MKQGMSEVRDERLEGDVTSTRATGATAAPSDGRGGCGGRAEEITLLDVVQAAEGPMTDDRCQLTGEAIDSQTGCPLHESWQRICRVLTQELMLTTVADLIRTRGDVLPRAG